MAHTVIGIDVGKNGAIARYDGNSLSVFDMPVFRQTKASRETIDHYALAELIGSLLFDHAFVEQIGALPTDGHVGAFSFGRCYGVVLGVLAANRSPMTLVVPQKWRAAVGVKKSQTKGDKLPSLARATELFPSDAPRYWTSTRSKFDGGVVKTHADRAEAALIAWYGLHRAG